MRVFVEDWQHECCGDPFAVGDLVAWTVDAAGLAESTLVSLGVEAIEDRHAMAEGPVRKVRGRVASRAVDRAPDGFNPPFPMDPRPGDKAWFETGMVVDLELTE